MDQNQPPQKLIDFNEELKQLCQKYQYEIRPVFQFDPLRGLFAILQAFEVQPQPDQGVQLNPAVPQQQPQPQQTPPVAPEVPATNHVEATGVAPAVEAIPQTTDVPGVGDADEAKKNVDQNTSETLPSEGTSTENNPVDNTSGN